MSAMRVLPWALHVALAYIAGIFLVVSPFVFGYVESSALPVLLGAGVIVLATAVLGRGSLGVFGILPVWAQAVLDYAIAFALMVSPFAFGFRDEADALFVSVMTGLGLLVMSLISRYPQPTPTPAPIPAHTGTYAAEDEEHTGTQTSAAHPESDPDLPEWVRGDDDGEYEEAAEAGEDRPDQDEASADEAADADRRRG